MKPTNLNTIAKHIAAWILWFGLTSLSMFTSETAEPFYWLRLFVNFGVNVVVFYAVFLVMRILRYNRRFDYPQYFRMSMWEKVEYHCRWPVLIVLAIFAVYAIGMDRFDSATGHPFDLKNYVPLGPSPDPRYMRIIPYILVAGGLAFMSGLRQWGDSYGSAPDADPTPPTTRWIARQPKDRQPK